MSGVENTTISADALLAQGYREHRPSSIDKCVRIFQRAFDDDGGRRYFVTFREWDHPGVGNLTYDAQVCADAADDGYVWITLKFRTIEATEAMAEKLWLASGGIYYEARTW